jgi:hypothetical protein
MEIKDSGVRQQFQTGSQRDTREGKGRFDLLPAKALKRLAQHFEKGGVKYSERNWELGQPLSRYLDSALRHCFAVLDNQTDEPHIDAAAWNLMCFMETESRIKLGLLPKELMDLPNPNLVVNKNRK